MTVASVPKRDSSLAVSPPPAEASKSPPRLWNIRFIIVLSVFIFLLCVGLPVWHYSIGAKRVSIHSYLNITSSSNLEWNQLNIVRFSQELFDPNVSSFSELDKHFDKLILSNGIKVISQNMEWREEWKRKFEGFSRDYDNLAKINAWLSEECFDVGDENPESTLDSLTSIEPLRGPENEFKTDLRIHCVHDRGDDAIFINSIGEVKLYANRSAFAKRLNALGRALLRIRRSPNIKQDLKKISLHLINLDPNQVIISNFPEEWSLKKWIFLKRLRPIFGDLQMSDNIMHYGHIPGWKEPEGNNSITINARDMQYLLNENVEWKFEAPNDPDHQLHFLILVTPGLHNVTLLDYDNMPSFLNAYTIPRWGGVSIFSEINLGEENYNKWKDHQKKIESSKGKGFVPPLRLQLSLEEMHFFLEIMTTQLRNLLGIIDPEPTIRASPELQAMVRVVLDRRIGIANWELQLFKRRKVLEFSFNAAKSLTSLIKIIDNMPDVMVDSQVAHLAKEALQYLKMADEAGRRGAWAEAVLVAHLANQRAEEAFFHPSLTSLLYFPLSQKLAVFLPFILPVFISVTVALLKEIGSYIRGK